MKIAPNQRQELDFLRDTLTTLEQSTDREMRQNFVDLRHKLDSWAAKVAVIGQVKAGKSTFLNAFLRQHDFLPSDINPWTSVVTNIRLNIPSDPSSGASFEFFDDADWQEIISGGTKIRELTEALLPGFDTELLRQQSEEMRERAQKRLGKHYHTLLGSKHEYDFLSPDLLKRYVCAGPGSDAGLERESLGRYAALTKVANVYMRMPEFQVPIILTDTPGVNDPFLVRDEFTCRSLDKSDFFVVVLSAHQPLTDVDVALIRILAKQDSKDCLIFVNRIDELDDYATDVPRVIKDVSKRLHDAIPGIQFRIVAGSAYLADLTLRDDEEAVEARASLDTKQLADFIRAKYGEVPRDQLDRLYLASGLDDVKLALSETIDQGGGRQQIAQLMGDVRAEINGAQFVLRRERDGLQMQVESIRSDVAAAAAEDLQAELNDIRAVREKLESHVGLADTQIEKILTKSWSGLEAKLLSCIDSFVEEQKNELYDRLITSNMRGGADKPIDIDMLPLQVALEKAVLKSYEKSRAGTDIALDNCMHACRQTIRDRFTDPTENISLVDLPFSEFNSTLTQSKRYLQLHVIADRGWAFWRKPNVHLDKTIAGLRTIAAAELRATVEKILTAYNEAQVERASAGMGRIQVMQRMIDMTISEQMHRLKKDKRDMENLSRDPQLQGDMVRRIQSKMEVLERRLLNLSALDSALSRSDLCEAA